LNSSRRSHARAVALPVAGQARLRTGPAAAASSAHAPITMQQAVEQALAHNPVLLSAQQNLLSMKGQEVEAGLRQNPDFSLYGEDLSNRQPRGSLRYSAQLSRLFRARAEAALAPG
jgi:cobalt-zinc-cadmium efflux system outer membrane protein